VCFQQPSLPHPANLDSSELRQTIQVQEIVFLEYIYFTVYLALLLTSIHTFLSLLKRLIESRKIT